MKKTLLINGCSFTAGDDIAWDHETHGVWNDFVSSSVSNKTQIFDNYINLIRPRYNFAGVLSRLLNTTSVDLSRDGNNNSEIALTTIGYISRLTLEERKNLHVCVGWTEPSRLCRWSSSNNKFISINPTMLDWYKKHKDTGGMITNIYNEFYENSLVWIASLKDIDIIVDDIFRVLAVENYLKAEKITYTFWKSIGNPVKESDMMLLKIYANLNLNYLDPSNWIKFAGSSKMFNKYAGLLAGMDTNNYPYTGISWQWLMEEDPNRYTTPGKHPSKIAVEELSNEIIHHIHMSELKAFE
jgi:hypothetical protein